MKHTSKEKKEGKVCLSFKVRSITCHQRSSACGWNPSETIWTAMNETMKGDVTVQYNSRKTRSCTWDERHNKCLGKLLHQGRILVGTSPSLWWGHPQYFQTELLGLRPSWTHCPQSRTPARLAGICEWSKCCPTPKNQNAMLKMQLDCHMSVGVKKKRIIGFRYGTIHLKSLFK